MVVYSVMLTVLISFVDEDTLLSGELTDESNGMHGLMCELWKSEFCPVAQDLLHRIERHSSNFEPL